MSERLREPNQLEALHLLRETIPFLRQIPDQIYFRLASSELLIPRDRIAIVRVDIENQLGHYVMTYRRDAFDLSVPPESHLCANVKGAELTSPQLTLLQEAEMDLAGNGVSFVAYQNPLMLIDPKQTALFDLYKKRGLVLDSEEMGLEPI